ncbi:hypothetical protein POM88_007918 [Heracleum sosnowskyi]|uniref:Response regulatory domain-containing protein n=1 Tax=Heracleum sosnowskyi TaxID=360622 RepID=A0AAD8N197_9APIA|nr:hypothetical protein POM88_007918 [Heracleum sosnowskyi]
MYRVLVVDDDKTCLMVATATLKKLNYQVMAVTCVLQALSILAHEKSDDGEKTAYDIVLADVHMPVMDGFELVRHIHRDFNIPVVLISADHNTETMCKGLETGASAYYLKPIKVDDVRNMWQYSELWKNRERHACRRTTQESLPKSVYSSSSADTTEDNQREGKTKKADWTPNLHTRFVEAMLILGSGAVPKNIVEVMNVPSLTRVQVGSHLQKFNTFLDSILDGKTSLERSSKRWIDYNYHSDVVGGNPNRILVKKRFEERTTGICAAPVPASLPLPPFIEAEASSRGSRNTAITTCSNFAASSVNVAESTLGHGSVTFQSAANVVATSTLQIGASSVQSVVNVGSSAPGLGCATAGNVNMENVMGSSSSSFVGNEFGNGFTSPQLNGGVGVTNTSSLIHNNAGAINISAAADNEMRRPTIDLGQGQKSNHGCLISAAFEQVLFTF